MNDSFNEEKPVSIIDWQSVAEKKDYCHNILFDGNFLLKFLDT